MNDLGNDLESQLDANFFNLVLSLSQAAFVGMGKITNPQTGEVEKSMDLARINIDILQMIKDKTNGNLSDKEKELITDTLMNLQLTYADEKRKDAELAKEAKSTDEPSSPEKADGLAEEKKEDKSE